MKNNNGNQAPQKGLNKVAKGLVAAAIISAVLGIIIVLVVPKLLGDNLDKGGGGKTGSSRSLKVGENSVRYREDKPYYFTPDEDGVYIFETKLGEEDYYYYTYLEVTAGKDGENIAESTSNQYELDERSAARLESGEKYNVQLCITDDYDEAPEKLSDSVSINIIKAPEITDSGTINIDDSDIYYYVVPEDGYYSFESSDTNLVIDNEYMTSVYSSYYDYSYLYVGEYYAGDIVMIESEDYDSTDVTVSEESYSYFDAFNTYVECVDDEVYVYHSDTLYPNHSMTGDTQNYNSSGYHTPKNFYYDESSDTLWFAFVASNSGSSFLMWYIYS